ncbi:hypothetical protein HK405_004666, partial [Cladochytrium tenue]
MGGPQSPATTLEECPHFDAAAERALISACITSGRAVIGVCLGAQLVGEALGARFEHSPEPEIGCFPISLTDEGRLEPLLSHLGSSDVVVGHWHADMPGLTPNASRLVCAVLEYWEERWQAGQPLQPFRDIFSAAKIESLFLAHLPTSPALSRILKTG